MIRTLSIAASLLILSACAARLEPGASPLKLIDLTGEFAAFEAETRDLDDAARAAGLKQRFARRLPGFYSGERVKSPDYDQRILNALRGYPKDRAGIEEVSRRFSALLAPAQRSFEAQFGPMTDYPPLYLVHSLGEFDGGTRDLPEGSRLMFGADVIARMHLKHDIQPFFHHELFHLYHSRFFSDCEPIWCALWTEGLATYVAAQLNPAASDDELMLTFPVSLREAVERNRSKAICSVLAKLNSTEAADYGPLFQGRPRENAILPPRYGYYVGFLVASEAAHGRSLGELARLPKELVEPLVQTSLRRLADCPP